MNAVSKDVRDKLVDAGLAKTVATASWFASVNAEPATPKDLVSVWDLPAPGGQYSMNKTRSPHYINAFQLRVRGIGQQAAWTKLEALRAVVAVWRAFTQGSMKYRDVRQSTDIFLIKSGDEDNTWVYAVNFTVWREA